MTNETNLALPPSEAAGDDQQPRPGGTGAARPPLRRYDGILGGVATGLADYFHVAPSLMRLAFVVLTFFGGLGILLYLAGWLVIPAEGADDSIVEGWLADLGTGRPWISAALIVLAAIWLLTALDIARSPLVWAVALLVLGVLLYRGETPLKQTASEEAALTTAPAAMPAAVSTAPTTREHRPPRPPRQPRVRRARPPSMLGRYTLAVGLIGIGVLALLDNAGVVFPDARHYLALSVAVVGIGLLIGSVWGRSRLLIVSGLLLAFMLGLTTIGSVVETFGDEVRTYAPSTIEELSSTYAMESGTLIIDLTQVDWQDREVAIDMELGAGQLEVTLPANVTATIDARAGVGQLDVLGRTSEGLGVGRSLTLNGTAGGGNIDVTLRVGAGEITVMQEDES